ncbi:hypothetical protein DEU56DRAFT_120083 [Suillus clintonianus]|uniref:uncharacterized protein n=1 Tax=Suillus clintonianus TaxID=1904413 RepID=UPI001B8791B6|nr:uncharacterized protein DEU56DRAFT_120083 [Suillus clintonianus]KAG2119437.1 hypothetical protein DEU56DRAFT_120083 [Suillus clintonianus]
MATTSQPITFQSPKHPDFHMASGSFTGNNNSIPYFLGSPISWRAGSFGSRFYPGCSPGQLLGPLDPSEFKCHKLSSSIDSDRGSILNALSAFDKEDELCRNYTCCGLQLDDLHALLQHFEEVHVVVLDPFGHPQFPVVPPLPQSIRNAYFPDYHQHPPSYNQGGFDPDDMELDIEQGSTPSSNASTPPDTPLTTPLSSHPTHSFNHFGQSKPASPHLPVSAFDTTTVLPSRSIHGSAFPPSRNGLPNVANAPDAFNGYAGYSDYSSSMPGTVPSPPASDDLHSPITPVSELGSPYGCLPPAVVFSTSNTPVNTPSASRVPSPASASRHPAPSAATLHPSDPPASKAFTSQQGSQRASTTLSRPASSLLLSKPFHCPKPNCNKSYKQANGLKYHMTHGSCNFAPPKDLEQVQALLASKRSAREAAGEDRGITEGEMREVEREAERRLRPFACGVSDCQRRYKNMNGLRYHYQHSGDHGAIGLSLLASGQHECLQHAHGRSSSASSRHSTPAASGHSTPVTGHSTPTYAQQYQQQMLYSSAQQQYLRQQQALQAQMQINYPAVSAEAGPIIVAQH